MSPLAWAAVNASASGIAMSKNVSSGMPPGGISFVSVFPSTRVMVRKWTPSSSSTESSVTMFGWSSAASARASCCKRTRRVGSAAVSAGRTFRATTRPSFVSSAR